MDVLKNKNTLQYIIYIYITLSVYIISILFDTSLFFLSSYMAYIHGNIVDPQMHANECSVLSMNYKTPINSYSVFTVYKITILSFIIPQRTD